MTDAELKPILRNIMGCLAAVTEKQTLELQLLAMNLSGLSDAERKKLLASAKESSQRAAEIRADAEKL